MISPYSELSQSNVNSTRKNMYYATPSGFTRLFHLLIWAIGVRVIGVSGLTHSRWEYQGYQCFTYIVKGQPQGTQNITPNPIRD